MFLDKLNAVTLGIIFVCSVKRNGNMPIVQTLQHVFNGAMSHTIMKCMIMHGMKKILVVKPHDYTKFTIGL